MAKKSIETIFQKNYICNNIIESITSRNNFLILGHKNPDEDCIGSTVAIALIISKFDKNISIYQGYQIHEHFHYLLNICKYNSINLLGNNDIPESVDTIIICDTPKPSMIDCNPSIKTLLDDKNILKIEIDHHIGADSEYIGDRDYCFVTEASSACELAGYIALKIRKREDILSEYKIEDPLSRNLVLSILTGIIGDSKMGNFLKSKRERKYYHIFSKMYNSILAKETIKETNLSNMNEVFSEIQRMSANEKKCITYMLDRKKISNSFGYVILTEEDMEHLYENSDTDTIVSVTRGVADFLAEESSKFGFVIYYDDPEKSDLIQFRLRRSKKYKTFDLRTVLEMFSIKNGGGHEGAIGFRVKRGEIDNINSFVNNIVERVDKKIEQDLQ